MPLKSKIDGAYFPSLRGFSVVLFTLHKLTLLFAKAVIDVIKKNFSRFLQIIVTGMHSIGTKIEYFFIIIIKKIVFCCLRQTVVSACKTSMVRPVPPLFYIEVWGTFSS